MGFPGFGASKSSTSSSSFVDPRQQPYLDFLRNAGQGYYQQYGQGAGQFAQQQGGQLFGQGQQYLNNLQSNPFMTNLQTQGTPGGDPNLINQQVGQLGADLGRNFQQQLLPGIRRDAIGLGGFGGTRQGVAEGLAAQGTQDAFARGATDIYSQNAQMANQANIAGAGINAQSQLGALAGLGGLFDLGMGQYTGGFSPLLGLSQIFGQPTVLDKSKGKSSSITVGGAPE
jgi:hypothetical protein